MHGILSNPTLTASRAIRSTYARYGKLGSCALVVLAAIPASAFAQTATYGDTMRALANACHTTIEKHCVGQIPGEGLGNCLAQHGSSECKAQVKSTIAVLLEREANQAAAVEICTPDIRRLCKDYKPGRGHYLTCITRVDIKPKVSRKCLQAVAAAGWM